MTDLLIFSIISTLCVIGLCVCIALILSRAITDAFRVVESMRTRADEHQKDLLNRLMTIKWEDYIATTELTLEEEGGFFAPQDQKGEVQVEVPPRWGHLSPLRDRFEQSDHEEELLREDFPEVTNETR